MQLYRFGINGLREESDVEEPDKEAERQKGDARTANVAPYLPEVEPSRPGTVHPAPAKYTSPDFQMKLVSVDERVQTKAMKKFYEE